MALIALLLSILFVELLLPYFNDFVDKNLIFSFFSFEWIATLVGIIVVIGIVAGSYPALVLSSFQPATVLKGSYKAKNSHQVFRSVLVVVQFTISIGLIVSMGVVYNQLNFIQNKELGLNKENVAIVPASPAIAMNYVDIRDRLIDDPGILDVSMAYREDGLYVENDFFKILDIDLIYGNRDELLTSPNTIVLSESMAKKYFGDGNPIGEGITINNDQELTVTGVYRDMPSYSTFQFDCLLMYDDWLEESP